ncbi:type II secretion system F family protein [Luteipulveratus mongoliensis]|uniref:Type II secretion system protein n=1 Tax=Luteipulveratus mongoliensis TaxID=571913 RepID=A0A0K1JNA6_9MICO|nr:type II secretion system F family protein [Luteipulveratus mongoliensis]AKU18073.1 type II secretion system protein [Luteipulveratus mongoliensis]
MTELVLQLLLGAVVGLGLFVGVLAVVGLPARDRSRPQLIRRASAGDTAQRLVRGVAAGLVALVLTRWVVAAVGLGLLAAFWDNLAGNNREERLSIARLEALASWTESLRDTIAGANGLEQAIPATAVNAGPAIRPSLNLLVDRLRIREPLPDALMKFAHDLRDPSGDIICAALVLNARLRGPGLRDVLTALALSTREELDMRRRIEASRKSIRRSVRIVLVLVLSVMLGLAIFNHQYVDAYDSPLGQLVLLLVALIFVGGLLWLRRLAMPAKMERFLVEGAQPVLDG